MRTADQVHELVRDLTSQYCLGAPGTAPYPHLHDEVEAHDYALAALDTPDAHDEAALHQVLIDCCVTNPASLRALLRLVGSYAAISALSWVLGEPLPDRLSAGDRPPTPEDVLREARAVLLEGAQNDDWPLPW